MDRFAGTTAVITGGGSGIGEATVRRLFAEGARIVILDANLENTRRVVASLEESDRVHAVQVDVSNRDAVEAAFEQAEKVFGALDVLVNCAGISCRCSVLDTDAETWRKVHSVNLEGTFHTMRSFCRRALAAGRSGAIVNVTSLAGIMGVPNYGPYSSTKHAVVGLTRTLAMEIGSQNIRVNAVAPGLIRTPMAEKFFDDPEMVRRIKALHPVGREGFPEEIAAAIAFLASKDASFVTGVVLPVDGGASAGKGL